MSKYLIYILFNLFMVLLIGFLTMDALATIYSGIVAAICVLCISSVVNEGIKPLSKGERFWRLCVGPFVYMGVAMVMHFQLANELIVGGLIPVTVLYLLLILFAIDPFAKLKALLRRSEYTFH